LLRKALQETQKVGIAKIIIRSKEQLAVIRVYENTLVMETIHFPDEVRHAADVPGVPAEDKVSKRELDTAILLIDQLTTEFEPEKYTDDYRTALLELIESKRTGKETVSPATKEVASNVTDLMAALQASIDRTKPKKTAAPRKKATPKVKKEA
jgi:DNA end-binding protein Ku